MTLAYDSDVTVLFVGDSINQETESFDRVSMRLDERLENVILNIAERTKKLVVVVEAGIPITLDIRYIDYRRSNCLWILHT